MSDKMPKVYPLERLIKQIEANFSKYETAITIVFGICAVAFPTAVSILATIPEAQPMSTFWGWVMALSLWIGLATGILLLRNSSKTATNRKLDAIDTRLVNIETAISNLTNTITELVNEMREERNERNNRKPTDNHQV